MSTKRISVSFGSRQWSAIKAERDRLSRVDGYVSRSETVRKLALRGLQSNGAVGVVANLQLITDGDCIIVSCCSLFPQILGLDIDAVVGRSLSDFVRSDGDLVCAPYIRINKPALIRQPEGDNLPAWLSTTPLYDADGLAGQLWRFDIIGH